jgi:predicted outer membrane repeat protein
VELRRFRRGYKGPKCYSVFAKNVAVFAENVFLFASRYYAGLGGALNSLKFAENFSVFLGGAILGGVKFTNKP